MARPKKSEPEQLAVAKIENAFWKLLETEPYSNITVRRISQESGVNRNSFYYHYKDIYDLTYQAFKHNAEEEVSRKLISALLTVFQSEEACPAQVLDMSILPHSKRIMLCAGSESPYLQQLANDYLKEVWLDSFSIKEEWLSLEERLQINFIFSGMIATLGSQEIKESPLSMFTLAQTEIGKSLIATMKRISLSQKSR